MVWVGELGGSNDLLLASSRPGICNIFCNIRGEQNGLLEHEGKLVPKVVELVVTDIDPVQQDLTAGHVVKSGQKADQRGFACTGPTYEADPGTRRNVEPNVVKDRPVVLISERDVSKRDGTQGARQRLGVPTLDDLRHFIEQQEGALDTGKMALKTAHFSS